MPNMPMIDRSFLFVPGSRSDRFDKALMSGAHAVIVDLEDAVGADAKSAARSAVAAWLSDAHPIVLRVNGVRTAAFADDVAVAARPGVAAVMLPKTDTADDVRLLKARVPGVARVLPMIESAAGMANAKDIAAVPGVERLVFGTLDFQLDLGIHGEDAELLHFRSHLVLVSRLAGIRPPVDGVTTNIGDLDALTAAVARVRRLGFGGKLCIHPKQVPIVNSCFLPTPDDVTWAQRVVGASAEAGGGVAIVDGKMIDRPVQLRAEEILSEAARAIAPHGESTNR
jgi:citrate lyase subunit beta/citryl-CoA lyase